jgi:glycosyltransferase involved in cell wall biosynthesis
MNKETGADISFVGSVKDMYKLLSSCHILVYPSRSQSEGFPAIITEAGANGLLVITSDFPGVNSVIINKQDGIIFKMENEADLSKKLTEAINRFEKYVPLTKNLYSITKELFSLEKMINKHQELYKSCLMQ